MVTQPRFIFLSGPGAARITGSSAASGVVWALVAANNRTLGRGTCVCETYASCRDTAAELQRDFDAAKAQVRVDEAGQFGWEVALGGVPVAISSRSYLRLRECTYNLDRFRAAVPQALLTTGIRMVLNGRL